MRRPAGVLAVIAAVVAVWMGGVWALVAGLAALGAGVLLWRPRAPQPGLAAGPTDLTHTLDLLRRAVGGRAAWAIGLSGGSLELPVSHELTSSAVHERGSALAEFAAAEGGGQVSREAAGTFVAVGDYPYACCVLLESAGAEPEPVLDELRRFVSAMRVAEVEAAGGEGAVVARRLAAVTAGSGTVEAVARAGAAIAHDLTHQGTAVVLRGAERSRVVALAGADPRLAGLVLDARAPAVRAIEGGLPVVATGDEDVFGTGSPERRRAERAGLALPLFDGRRAIGALVIVGRGMEVADESLSGLVKELGPRLAAARALQAAEHRATTDVLTGLPNRAKFERLVRSLKHNGSREHATLLYVDIDHFKKLNDSHGHAAGDAALKHVAAIFAEYIRGRDLVARIGGEEFAVWLPGTPLAEGVAVADRIRRSVASKPWTWAGREWPLTVSCGVAAMPEHAQDPGNLLQLADEALYRAKEAGRNRVEKARAAG